MTLCPDSVTVRKSGDKLNVKLILIILVGIFLIYYRFAIIWTPFWFDVTFIAVVGFAALISWVSDKKEEDREKVDVKET
jgi:hypothetical protein